MRELLFVLLGVFSGRRDVKPCAGSVKDYQTFGRWYHTHMDTAPITLHSRVTVVSVEPMKVVMKIGE
jgi:hypothetical protein